MSARHASTVGSRRWIATLAALTGIVALSIDMSLPAQPTLARRFAVSSETAQLTLSLFLLGFAGAQLFVGYLSDAWGRRRVLLGGLALFVAAGIACALAPSIEVLIACRVLQGCGAAAAPVVARAMVRDTQPAAQAARLLSTMLAALALAPMIGPVIGGAVLRAVGWRAIFASLAACGVVLLAIAHATLAETLPAERRARASIGGLMRSFARFFATRGTKLPMLIGCATFAGQFAYIADSPFVLMEGYGVSAEHFGFYFAMTAVALMLGSLTGGRLLRGGRSPGSLTVIGTAFVLVGGVAVAIGTRLELGIAGFMAPMVLYFFGTGISSPSATAMAMAPVPQIAGTASAAIGASTMIAGALAGYETTRIGGSDPRMFALVAVVMSALAFGLAVVAAALRAGTARAAARA